MSIEDPSRRALYRRMLEGQPLDPDELEAAHFNGHERLYGALVSDWSGRREELRRRLETNPDELSFVLDILHALAVISPNDPAGLFNRGSLLHDLDRPAEAEGDLIASALLSRRLRESDPTEVHDEDLAWAWAAEAALAQGHLLTAYAIASIAPDGDTRAEVLRALQPRLQGNT